VSERPLIRAVGSVKARALRLLLANDSLGVRSEFRAALEGLHGVEVVGEVNDGIKAVELFLQHLPHIVVLSVSIPPEGGFNVLKSMRQAHPECVVILTTYWRETFVKEVGRLLGAEAVCSTIDGSAQIVRIVQDLLNDARNRG